MRDTFARIYQSRARELGEASAESRSGTGSNLAQTAALRAALPALVAELGIRSFLDVPCGDFFWMAEVDLGVETYLGGDIVPALIDRNRARFARPGREFRTLDLTRDRLPAADLVFSRDCLVHLRDEDIRRALAAIKESGSTYLAMTTFPDHDHNAAEIEIGAWRPLNFRLAPFLLPPPLRLIDERCTEVETAADGAVPAGDSYADKSVGLWRVADL
jgi:hypothetical protein